MAFSITKAAKDRIQVLLERDERASFLRIIVLSGGCSGLRYDFTLDFIEQEGDQRFLYEGGAVVIDSVSYDFLSNATLDFVEELASSSFVIQNPQATMSCGCGNSFSI